MAKQNDERLGSREEVDPERESRATQERTHTENRLLTDKERLEAFRGTFFKEALPDLPPLPGYHMCWLTTTNPRDSIPMRLRLGYELVRVEELGPAFVKMSVKTGQEFAGHVMVNEMIAAKLPDHLYQLYMLESHHYGPAREQEKLTAVLDNIREQAERSKAKVIEEEGTAELRRSRPAPTFAG